MDSSTSVLSLHTNVRYAQLMYHTPGSQCQGKSQEKTLFQGQGKVGNFHFRSGNFVEVRVKLCLLYCHPLQLRPATPSWKVPPYKSFKAI